MIERNGEIWVVGRESRERQPVESALDTKMVVRFFVV